jgi:hypothetical protein
VNPLERADSLDQVDSAIDANQPAHQQIRRWPRKRLSKSFEIEAAGTPARVVDLSYGRLRLALNVKEDLPATFDIVLPTPGLSLKAHRIWTPCSPAVAPSWFGVTIVEPDLSAHLLAGFRRFRGLSRKCDKSRSGPYLLRKRYRCELMRDRFSYSVVSCPRAGVWSRRVRFICAASWGLRARRPHGCESGL